MMEGKQADDKPFVVLLRDIDEGMVRAWEADEAFGGMEEVKISLGDIFEGAPSADAIVSPANSFGFMDGGIDMVYTNHFGWQMMERLQDLLRREHDGELPVGNAVIIPAYSTGGAGQTKTSISPTKNEGQPIKYLISAPTMRIPTNVNTTVNAYLAFRAVLREVRAHNRRGDVEPIRTVLCPGLGTAVGRMPHFRCAIQMRKAFDVVMRGCVDEINRPGSLAECCSSHVAMCNAGASTKPKDLKPLPGELFVHSAN